MTEIHTRRSSHPFLSPKPRDTTVRLGVLCAVWLVFVAGFFIKKKLGGGGNGLVVSLVKGKTEKKIFRATCAQLPISFRRTVAVTVFELQEITLRSQ